MKKLIAFLCVLSVCFSLASCGKDGGKDEVTTDANVSADETASSDLAVKTAMINDGNIILAVENNFKKSVTGFEFAYVCYNSSGSVISDDYEIMSSSDINIAPGQKQVLELYFFNDDCVYVDTMITSVTFDDDDTWEAKNIKSWSKKALKNKFDIEAYKANVAAMATEATASKENPYLDITTTFVYDNYAYVVAENISEKTILDFKVIYLCYDANGLPVGDGYEVGNASSVNMLSGEKNEISFYTSSCVYIDAIISSVTFDGGEIWENPDAKIWAITRGNFAVKEYNTGITAMAENAKKAETNPYITIVSTKKFDDNSYSSQDDFDFDLKNVSDKTISSTDLIVLEYDANGYAVATSPYDSYCKNSRMVGGTVNLTPGKQSRFNSGLFFESDCKQYKCIVSSVTFEDGTEWTNPYLFEWILVNSPKYIAS